MTIVAISPDEAADARVMAKRYGIDFALLSDQNLALAKQFAGVSSDGYPLPAVYLLRPDGSVYLRKIGDAKDDRIYAKELLVHLDAMLGEASKERPQARGFERPYRLHARLGLGAHRLEGEHAFAGDLSFMGMRSLGRNLALGAEIGGLLVPEREARVDLVFQAQMPIWAGLGEVYGQMPLGLTQRFSDGDSEDSGIFFGFRLGLGFEVNPNLVASMEAALETSALGGAAARAYSSRLLVRTGVGWKF